MTNESKIVIGVSIIFFIVIFKMCSGGNENHNDYKEISDKYVKSKTKKRNSTKDEKVIYMKREGGVYKIPCKVNGVELEFIFDTGAADVSLSSVEANFLYKRGLITDNDFLGKQNYITASGEIVENTQVILREIEIDGLMLYDVEASISDEMSAPLLLGQSAIQKLGTIQINGNKLIIIN